METHPDFQRQVFSRLPVKKVCVFCGELADVVVHAFCEEGHCEKNICVNQCDSCLEWFEAIEEAAPPEPKKAKEERSPEPENDPLVMRITEEEWRKYKARMKKANRHHGDKNNFAEDNEDASGYVAEDHAMAWFGAHGVAAVKLSSDESRSPIDVAVFGRRVDVKATNRTVDPVRLFYHVNVKEEHIHNPMITDYMFSSFNTRTLESNLVGWLPKEEFVRVARKMEKGEVSGMMVARNEMRCCQLKDLRKMDSILVNFSRGR